jgi:sugar lactone lactonase YvrE
MDKRLLFAFLFTLFFTISYAQTDVSGILTASTTWTKAQSPYILKGSVTVPTGMSLTIEPGATIVRNSSYRIIVNGAIKANGSKTDSITFKSGNLLDNNSLFFIDFQKTNLDLSILNYISFKNESNSTNNLRLGRETSTPTGSLWNSGSLLVSNSNLSKGYTITEGYKGAFSLEIKRCSGIEAYVTSPSSDAERIVVTNSRFFNSTFNSDLQIGGIELKQDFFKDCKFLIGCCDTRLKFDSCKLDNSFLLNTPNVSSSATGSVSISNTIMLNTPITTPYNTYRITKSKLIADRPLLSITGKVLPFMVDVGELAIENSEISSFKDMSNNGIKTLKNNFYPNTFTKNLLTGLTNSVTVYTYSDFQINESNFLDNKSYAITNTGSKPITVNQSFFELKEGQKLIDLFQERTDDLGAKNGTIQSSSSALAPFTTPPIAAPTNVIKSSSGSAVTVSWIKNPAVNVKGYKVYWGYVDGFTYSNSVEVAANDSSYTIANIDATETIAVTALTVNAKGINDQINGYESWFAPAGIPTPIIKSFTPRIAGENYKITIDGYNLGIASNVNLGGVPVSAFTVVSPTRLIATVGNGKSGNVSITNNFGSYEKEGFNFIPPPLIASVKPVPTTVNSTIGVNGSNFLNTKEVTVGGVKTTWYTVVSDKLITVKVPAGARSGAVTITTPYGTGTSNGFEYMDAPQITYKASQVFEAGQSIAPLTPDNKGGTIPTSVYGNTTTFAGNGQAASIDGNGGSASFNNPIGIAADEQGNLYVTEQSSHRIRKVTPDGAVTTLAGGTQGFGDGVGSNAKFNSPVGIAVGLDGNIYVADQGNNRIRKITRDGVVSTYLGTGAAGSTDGYGSNVTFNQPTGVATSPSGGFYVTEQGSNRIRNIGGFGAVTTFAGNGNAATVNGTGSAISFNKPAGIAVDANGNVFVTESAGNVIRKITPTGTATTLAGNGRSSYGDGNGFQAGFSQPYGLTIDKAGMLYVADRSTNTIRIISPQGDVNTLAGSWTGNSGSTNGVANNALFSQPTGVVLASGKLYVSDFGNRLIRSIDITGYSIAPSLPVGLTFNNQTGAILGKPASSLPATDYTVTAANVVGADTAKIRLSVSLPPAPNITYNTITPPILNIPIKSITPNNTGGAINDANTFTTIFTGASSGGGFADGKASTAQFGGAAGIVADQKGNFFIADSYNNRIRKVTPDGTVSTLAGTGVSGSTDGASSIATFNNPTDVVVDVAGNVYVTDAGNKKIRKITSNGIVSTYSGTGANSSTDGSFTSASFSEPKYMANDIDGNLYVSEPSIGRVRKLAINGTVSTLATGLNFPRGLAVDATGNVYVAESNKQIRKITPSGSLSILLGASSDFSKTLIAPIDIAIDGEGNLFVIDQSNFVARKVYTNGTVEVLPEFNPASSPTTSFFPNGITVADGALYMTENGRVRKVSINGYRVSPALPSGLSIDRITGIISGTPTSLSAEKEYAITATNAGGSSSTKIAFSIDTTSSRPRITAITGVASSGQIVTINGKNFEQTSAVTFGTKSAASFKVISSTLIEAIVGNGESGNITVQTPNGIATIAGFNYINKPVIKSITPMTGGVGTVLTVEGTDIINSTTVTIGGVKPRLISADRAVTKLYISVGEGASGDIVLTTPAGSATYPGFKYTSPFVTSITPTSARAADIVTINGSNFNDVKSVYIGNKTVKSFTIVSDSIMTFIPGMVNKGLLQLVGNTGTAQVKDFTFIEGPVIDKFTPTTAGSVGRFAGARNNIFIIGDFLDGATAVTIGGMPATSFSVSDRYSITATVPEVINNDGRITVTTPLGTTYATGFKFIPRPQIKVDGPTTFAKGKSVLLTASAGQGYTYQWVKGNFDIPGATGATFTATEGDYYSVKISVDDWKDISEAVLLTSVFNLPATNFKVVGTNITCKGQNNGIISIKAAQLQNYSVFIRGPVSIGPLPFKDSLSVPGFPPGTYNVCLTVTGQPDFRQCFDLVISEPKDLSVYATTNKASGMLTLALAGGSNYKVTLNGTVYKTSAGSITVPLQSGSNKLTVTTDQPCQGTFEEFYVQADKQLPYPNPFQDVIYINLGEQVINKVTVKLYDVSSGAIKISQQFTAQSGVVRLEAAQLSMGVYSMHLTMDGKEKVYKLIKK